MGVSRRSSGWSQWNQVFLFGDVSLGGGCEVLGLGLGRALIDRGWLGDD